MVANDLNFIPPSLLDFGEDTGKGVYKSAVSTQEKKKLLNSFETQSNKHHLLFRLLNPPLSTRLLVYHLPLLLFSILGVQLTQGRIKSGVWMRRGHGSVKGSY